MGLGKTSEKRFLTIGLAAKETGRAKSTIYRALKDGTLEAQKDNHGRYMIDPEELAKTFPENAPQTDGRKSRIVLETARQEVTIHELRARVEEQRETIADLRKSLDAADAAEAAEMRELRARLATQNATVADLRRRLDRESEERRRLTTMLTERRSFWRRIFEK